MVVGTAFQGFFVYSGNKKVYKRSKKNFVFSVRFLSLQSQRKTPHGKANGNVADKLEKLLTKRKFYTPAEVAHLVEHDLAKVGVAGSSPVFRSKV